MLNPSNILDFYNKNNSIFTGFDFFLMIYSVKFRLGEKMNLFNIELIYCVP